jgi:UDPglucose 6-dehydrogenase
MRISVIGLGKLGSPLAAVLASKGHDVIGLDLNPAVVQLLTEGRAPVYEPGLQELIDSCRSRLRATGSYQEAVLQSDLSFVIVPTPSGPDGTFLDRYVLAAVQDIARALRGKPDYHVVAITSTVMPGTCGGKIRGALQRHSGRRLGETLGLCYNPEFIALGSVIPNKLYPDMLLIGESDRRAGDLVEAVYRQVCEKAPPVQRMNLVNAEITKIAVNTFVTTKITYANMLSSVCERLPGADVEVVTSAVGLDRRIGRKYLQGGLGYGGPCFPRDNVAFTRLARRIGVRADLAEATDRLNAHQIDRLLEAATRGLLPGAAVGVLGLAYKPETGVIEESQGLALVRRLAQAGYRVLAYDPLALPAAHAVAGDCFTACASAEECVLAAERVVVTTAWRQFTQLDPPIFARRQVIDCWRCLPADKLKGLCRLVYLGRGPVAPLARRASALREEVRA